MWRNIGQFVRNVFTYWGVLLSGISPIIIFWIWSQVTGALGHPEMSATLPAPLKWALIMFAVVIASFRAWRSQQQEVLRLAEIVRPKLRCSFNSADPGCVRPGVKFRQVKRHGQLPSILSPSSVVSSSSSYSIMLGTSTESLSLGAAPTMPRPQNTEVIATYYRIKVETDGVSQVPKCRGRLLSIKRDNEFVFSGEPTDLPFAPSERPDAIDKTVHDKAPEYLDFLAITNSNEVFITTYAHEGSSSVDWANLFREAGEYTLNIAIASVGPSRTVELKLDWTGNEQTSNVHVTAST